MKVPRNIKHLKNLGRKVLLAPTEALEEAILSVCTSVYHFHQAARIGVLLRAY